MRVYSNPQFDDFYNGMARDASRSSVARLSLQKLEGCEEFFLGSVLWIALLGTPWVLKDRRTRFLLVQFAICALGLLTVYWFNPHYAAPVTATGIALLMQSMRHLRRWEIQRRPIGVFLTRLVLAMVMARVAVYIYRPPAMKASWSWSRAQISSQLRNMPGNHLVLVRYAPGHDPNDEWVFNAADIDHSRIVWARDIPDVDPAPLLDYFADRKIWSLDADALHPRLSPFRMEETRPALSANGGNTLRGRP